jgi:hypothetical protein
MGTSSLEYVRKEGTVTWETSDACVVSVLHFLLETCCHQWFTGTPILDGLHSIWLHERAIDIKNLVVFLDHNIDFPVG